MEMPMPPFRFRAVFFLLLGLTLLSGPAGMVCAADQVTSSPPDPVVKLSTSLGDIVLRLNARKAPNTVSNFIQYVKSGHYDNTIFHRVIKGFMIQGGGFTPEMKEKPARAPIHNEADNALKNLKYTVAMARTNEPHSATAQFFINVGNNAFLDFKSQTAQGWGYAVFGQVISGQNVVDKIALVRTGRKGYHDDVPLEPVLIRKAAIME
jgi:peptidyl-prolyl cis-trans isomerase B (cyclophilin B)